MYADKDRNVINENNLFIGSDGTQYPRNFPKDEIKELTKVTETPKPKGKSFNVTGFTVDKNYRQVWTKELKTREELKAEALDRWKSKIAEHDKRMPRSMEDHIKAHHGGVTGDPYSQASYDEKRKLRREKPEE